ncbi:MAG: aminoacyl-tRNA hydrolase [Gemmatimonadota bacterium]|nr:MAG: aminoacyl-tRNA hydrolase [Gemmatimonadota bacterium]
MAFTVPSEEVRFRASRASGPGGQHVNRAATRVEARWNVRQSKSLTDEQRARLLHKLANRIDARGVLRVVADERRSQLRNREAALARLTALVTRALRRPKPRKKTRRPRAAEERRLAEKRRRSDTKRERRPPKADD